MGRGPTWTHRQVMDLMTMDDPSFLAKYPDRTGVAAYKKRLAVQASGGWPPQDYIAERGLPSAYTPEQRAEHQIIWGEHLDRLTDRALSMTDPTDPTDIPDDDDALFALFNKYVELRVAKRNALGEPDRVVAWEAPVAGPIGICFIGDIHLGGDIEMHLVRRDIELVRETDGLYTVLMGDLIDNFKHQGKNGSGLYEGLIGDPVEQLAILTGLLRRIRTKIIAMIKGNHEEFDGRWAGIDRLKDLADHLGVTYFTEAGGSIFAYVGEQRYHLIAKHQFRGSKQNGANTLYNEWPWTRERPDVVCLAHLHEPSEQQVIRNGENVTYLRGGTYKIDDEYAASKGFRCYYGVPLVIVYPDERKIIPIPAEHFTDGVRFLQQERARYA
jgi:predicted phosphodiesterase